LNDRRSAHEALCRWLVSENFSWSYDTWWQTVELCLQEAASLGDDRSMAFAHEALADFYSSQDMEDSAHVHYGISRDYFGRAGDEEHAAIADELTKRYAFVEGRFDLFEQVGRELVTQAEQEPDLGLRYEKYEKAMNWLSDAGDFFEYHHLEQHQGQIAALLKDGKKKLKAMRADSVYAFHLGDYQRSAELFELSLSKDAEQDAATQLHWLKQRGLAQLYAGNTEQAIAHFRNFMSMADRDDFWPHHEQSEIIVALLEANQHDIAGELIRRLPSYDVPYEEWQSINSIHRNLQFAACEYLLASGEYERVKQYVEPVDDDWIIWFWDTRDYLLGKAYLGLGESELAIEHLQRHVDQLLLDPTVVLSTRHINLLGDAYLARGEDDKALEHYFMAFAIGCEEMRMLLIHRFLVKSPLIDLEESAAKGRAVLQDQGRISDAAALEAQLEAAVAYRAWLADDMPGVSARTRMLFEELSRLRSASYALSLRNANPYDYSDRYVTEHRLSPAIAQAGRREKLARRQRVAERLQMYEADADRLLQRIAVDDPAVAELVNLGPLDQPLFAPYNLYAWTDEVLAQAVP
jgi:hypothetical protein